MKKTLSMILSAALCVSMLAFGTAAVAETAVTGTVTAAGSSALLPLAQAAADAFMEKNPDCSIVVNGGGSGQGLKQVADGAVDIGNSDVFAEQKLDADAAKSLVDHKVCTVTMAAVVNKALGVSNLTTAQLTHIFTAKITNWKDVGGADLPIVAFQRREDSGSQTLFQKLLIQGGELMDAPTELAPTEMGGLVDSIAEYNNTANAIGFSVYYYIDQMYSKPGLRLLAVDGVTPSNDTLADGSYPLCNDFYAVIHPDAAADSPERRLYDWLDITDGIACIQKAGYVPAQSAAKAN